MKYELLNRLDKLKWNKFHTQVSVALGIAWMLDSFEVTIIGNIMGVFKKMWGLTELEQSWILSVWFIGIMIGSYVLGYLADRFGRKRLFLITLLLYGTFTLLTAIAWNYQALLVLRLLTAIGVGAEYAAINAAISEFIPTKYRGKANAHVMNFWSLGPILAALVTLFLLNALPEEWGWRVAFGFGALVSLVAAIIRRYIPESPRWLIEQGDLEAAAKVVEGIEEGRVSTERFASKQPKEKRRSSFIKQTRELITHYPGRLALGSLLDFSEAAGYYGIFAFLPIFVLPEIQVKETYVPFFYLIANIGGLIGGLIVAYLLERIGRKLTVPLFYTAAAGGVLLLSAATITHNWVWVLVAFTVATTFANGSWISAYVTFAEIFPTHLRSTGIGISVAVGRIGGVISPLMLTAIATSAGVSAALIVLSAFWLIGAFAMVPWYFRGVEGKGRTLEEMINKEKVAV
ncbi:MFS transporter [Paenibacillus kobensis]|uniref:MFS transporter n=1 Tax=Paenibacillus kobensis TaxID=59841 RepID=UPI001C3F5F6C|nr:MFS transporter [Paenibacillus kobensis]